MQLLRLSQIYRAKDFSKENKLELARKIDLTYSIPNDTHKNLQKNSYPGYNCLHIAALQLDFDFIQEFVQRGADPLKQGIKNGKTPLHVAVDVKTNSKNKSLWEISGKLQDCQAINTLFAAHVNSGNPLNPKCSNGISHFHIACMFNNVETVKFFPNNGEPIDHVTNSDSLWPLYTPLHFAIRYSSVDVAEILLNHKADLYTKNAEGISPFHILIHRVLSITDYINMGQRAICKPYENELERLEAIVNIVMQAISENEVNFLDDIGLTIFHLACCLRDPSITASFLNDNLDLNKPIKSESKFWPGWTPLHFAACSSAQTVILLIQKGADITIKNEKGETPLDFCLKRFSPLTIHSILSTREEFKSILLSDVTTTLLDLILAMNDMTSLLNYLESLSQPDICISPISPLLPGYNLLHLALSMNERMKFWDHYLTESDALENTDSFPQNYNCTEDENRLYSDRINSCLEKGCSVSFKNFDGLTPIHFAFKTQIFKFPIFVKLFKHCKEDSVDPDNLSHLHIACATGIRPAVKMLMDLGANVNVTTKKSFQWYKKHDRSSLITINANSTPLHIAIMFEREGIVKILLDNVPDVYAMDSEGFTPIHLSIAHSKGSNELAKILIKLPEELIELVTTDGLSHLHVAAFAEDEDSIKKLIRNNSDVNCSVNLNVPSFLSNFAGKTALQILTQNLQNKVGPAVKILIESGADIYANDTLQCLMREIKIPISDRVRILQDVRVNLYRELGGRRRIQDRLHEVHSKYDFSQLFAERLRLNENLGAIDSSGLTLLHVACSVLDINWATELLNRGANVNARIRSDDNYEGLWNGYTPLHALIYRKHKNANSMIDATADRLGKLLLERGADVMINSEDGTPLHLSYCHSVRNNQWIDRNAVGEAEGQEWIPDYLTSAMMKSQTSYETNPTNSDGISHFHLFCMINTEAEKVKQYLQYGVDIDHMTNPFAEKNPGYSGLHFAFSHQAFHMANLLIERRANVRLENAYGNTLLHLMILKKIVGGRRGDILTLQRHGANFKAKNLQGQTPIDVLMTIKHFDINDFQYFLSKGSSITVNKSNSSPGPAVLIMENASRNDRLEIFRTFIYSCDVPAALRNGYDLVSEVIMAQENLMVYEEPALTPKIFVEIVQQLVYAGCQICQPYEKGSTELQKCIELDNTTAVNVWLLLGADVNVCNINHQIFDLESISKIEELLALQIYKMRVLGFYVSVSCNLIYYSFKRRFPIDAAVDIRINLELEKAKTVRITEKLTARAFLSELWGTLYYSKLTLNQRQAIDAFFKRITYLYEQFPTLCGLMILQYKKALVRSKLIEPAKEVLANECNMDFPDPCLDCLLSYMSYDELMYLIENSEETMNPCKRARIE